MAKPKVVLLDDGYRLEVNGKVSEESDYGDPVELRAGGNHYVGFLTVSEEGQVETPLAAMVYRVYAEENVELVDESAGVDDEANDADEEDDTDDEEEPETTGETGEVLDKSEQDEHEVDEREIQKENNEHE